MKRRPIALGLGGIVLLSLGAVGAGSAGFRSFGGAPDARSRARMEASPEFADGAFRNPEPTQMMIEGSTAGSLWHWLAGDEMRVPSCPLPLARTSTVLSAAPKTGLRVTWLGHSTTLIEIDGARVLTDPMWSERASPVSFLGPARFHPPPLPLSDLPRVDAVLISHEHYDHLDMRTIQALAPRGPVFHVPLGIGAHLLAWGVPPEQIVEHDWWERAPILPGVEVVSTPARHFNGRGLPWRTGALWTSWSLVGPQHRVFISGDTGLTEAMRAIAQKEGPFDVVLLEIGQYHHSWGEIHLGPAGALEAMERLQAKVLIPIHWGTFSLAYHAWSEPAETVVKLSEGGSAQVLTPLLGEAIEPTLAPPTPRWWRQLPPETKTCIGSGDG